VRARVAADDAPQRLLDGLYEDLGQPARRHGAERIAVETCVLCGDPAVLAADPHRHGAPLASQLVEHPVGGHALEAALLRLLGGQVADRPQHVVEAVCVRGAHWVGQALEVGLDLGQRVGVDQVAQLLLAEQLAEQIAVERQCRRAPLGVRRVALVHVGRDVVEQERRGERRGARRLHLDERDLAAMQPPEQIV
jgi:hypothetical protein